MKRFVSTVSQKSAEGKVGQAVGKAIEALQSRKPEQQIGPRQAGFVSLGWQQKAKRRRYHVANAASPGRQNSPARRYKCGARPFCGASAKSLLKCTRPRGQAYPQ